MGEEEALRKCLAEILLSGKIQISRSARSRSCFRRGVNKELSTALSYQLNLPTDFATFARTCITLDNQARLGRNYRPAPFSYKPPQTSQPLQSTLLHKPVLPALPTLSTNKAVTPHRQMLPAKFTPAAGDPMDLSRASQLRGPLFEVEKKHRRENNLCNYCGEGSHFANTCPNKRSRPVISAATFENGAESAMVLYEAKN